MLIIHKASAGSGKTFQLALTYIRELLSVPRADERRRLNPALLRGTAPTHSSILAITFTNKATAEMKDRIIAALAALAAMPAPDAPDHAYAARLTGEFGCSRRELSVAAANALTGILLSFDSFNVSTIDSFFQSVLRVFARELDCQGDYEIELDLEAAIRDAVDLMLDEFNRGRLHGPSGDPGREYRSLETWIWHFIDDRVRNATPGQSVAVNLFNRQGSVYKTLVADLKRFFKEGFKMHQQAMTAYLDNPARLEAFERALDRRRDGMWTDLAARANAFMDTARAHGMDGRISGRGFGGMLDKLCDPQNRTLPSFDTQYVQALLSPTPQNVTGTLFRKGKGDAVPQPVIDAAATLGRAIAGAWAEQDLITNVRAKLYMLRLLRHFNTYLELLRRERNMLVLDDTNSLLARIIGTETDVPFIYEQMGTHLRSFLIDEFQDTSRMQWNNLRHLVDNGLAQGFDSLIIGDTKQAIYRFRNSDASMLAHKLQDEDYPDPRQRTVRGTTVAENINYRSAPAVVRFNNTLFPLLALQAGVTGYSGGQVVQDFGAPVQDLQGRVVLHMDHHSRQDDQLDTMVSRIKEQHAAGYRWGDIAVLVNSHTDGALAVARLLNDTGEDIPVQSDEALLLKNSRAVRVILSLMRAVDRSHTINAATGARPGHTRATMDDIDTMMSRYDFLASVNPGAAAHDLLMGALAPDTVPGTPDIAAIGADIASHKPSTLNGLVETILALGYLAPDIVQSDKDYIAAFLDVLLDYSRTHDNDTGAFIRWWTQNSDRFAVSPPPHANAVKVMTIHKSKGLEFDCVHVPFVDWQLGRSRPEDIWLVTRDSRGNFVNPGIRGIDPDLFPPVLQSKPLSAPPPGLSGAGPAHTFQHEQNALDTADALNKTYVAFTRARRELDVYCASDRFVGRDIAAIAARIFDPLSPTAWQYASFAPLKDIEPRLLCQRDTAHVTENPETGSRVYALGKATAPEDGGKPGAAAESSPLYGPVNATLRPDVHALVSVESTSPASDSDIPDDSDDDVPVTGVLLRRLVRGLTCPDKLPALLHRMVNDGEMEAARAARWGHVLPANIPAEWYTARRGQAFLIPHHDYGRVVRVTLTVDRPDGSIHLVQVAGEARQPLLDNLKAARHAAAAIYSPARVTAALYMPLKGDVITV